MSAAPDFEHLARIHARAFTHGPRPWSASEIAALAAPPLGLLLIDPSNPPMGFALLRVVVDEAELLTLAVNPEQQRRGVARGLLSRGLAEAAARGARRIYLEVASENLAARTLYEALGFVEISQRSAYYGASPTDAALICARAL